MCGAGSDPLAALATRALAFVKDGTLVGLGTGRAATAFVHSLAGRVKEGLSIRGVPTSETTARLARELGIPLAGLEEGTIEVTVDGADEVDPQLNLIKGYGGALLRERIVAAASLKQVILVDASKLVPVLGTRGCLPIEVVPFALPFCTRRLVELGYQSTPRLADGKPFVSDSGNVILDLAIGPLENPGVLDGEIRRIPGVVDTGLFLGTAHTVLLAEGGTVRELRRRDA